MELNFEIQKWNIPTDRVLKLGGKNMVICLVIMFSPDVMIIKMSKMAYFIYFLPMTATNQSQFLQNIKVYLKDLT